MAGQEFKAKTFTFAIGAILSSLVPAHEKCSSSFMYLKILVSDVQSSLHDKI